MSAFTARNCQLIAQGVLLSEETRPASLPLSALGQVQSRYVEDVNGLTMHLLEAGDPDAPGILLLHGFPDLAWGWRKVLGPLARAGYRVIAPDLRGYGRTTGWSSTYDTALRPFGFLNLVKDLVALLRRLDISRLHGLVGHDFGAPLAAWTALLRPDLIDRLVLMSAPFAGPPGFGNQRDTMAEQLAQLSPPRQHYQHYYTQPQANQALWAPPQGLRNLLLAYYHMKSADWPDNQPRPLAGWRAEALARLPHYYVMRADQSMAETVAPHCPIAPPAWLPEQDLAVYTDEYQRTGFQGGLNWYRCNLDPTLRGELAVFHRRRIPAPCWFVSGAADWGNHQTPGALKRLETTACEDYRGTHLIDGAGHWVQQEQPDATVAALLAAMATDRRRH